MQAACSAARAAGSFLFRVADDGPHCIAKSGNAEPSPGLLQLVAAFLASEIANDTELTRETDAETDAADLTWRTDDDTRYRPVVLGNYTSGRHVVQGVAVLELSSEQPFVYPAVVASQLDYVSEEATSQL